jgi:hypothetical protein
VSTNGQTLAAQDAALHAAGCAKVYGEKQSGARIDRPELAQLLRRLESGDVLMVTPLNRLARSTRLAEDSRLGAFAHDRLRQAGECRMTQVAAFLEVWCAVANAKLIEFRRKCWRRWARSTSRGEHGRRRQNRARAAARAR